MTILLYIVQVLFGLLALALLLGFGYSKHIGLLLAGLAFGGAASISVHLAAWWPLAVGFVVAWILRILGFDPSVGS